MNLLPFKQDVRTPVDAALARIRLDRITRFARLPAPARIQLIADVTDRLAARLPTGEPWRLSVDTEGPQLRIALSHGHTMDAGWETTVDLPAPLTSGRPPGTPKPGDPLETLPAVEPESAELAGALLDTSDLHAMMAELHQERDSVAWHRRELEQTNQGVLALHAELQAAGETQRKLLAAEQAARAATEAARSRLLMLTSAGAALAASLDRHEIVTRLIDLLVPDQVTAAQVWMLDEDGDLTDPRQTGEPWSSPTGDDPAARAAATGRPHHVAPSPSGLAGVTDVISPDGPAVLAIPLVARGQRLGILQLTAPKFVNDDVIMLIELSRRAATALDNAIRYGQERETAQALQRAMLTELPQRSDVRLVARYLPAASGINIGGDWYDGFTDRDGNLVIVVGDVTGHGLAAAVLMSQLRQSLRAYAIEGGTPGSLLTRLHDLLQHLEPDLFATAIVAQMTPGSDVVTWASAGHLPPLLRHPDGHVEALQQPHGALLGLPIDQVVPDHQFVMSPGSTLLFYTDGLIERRDRPLDDGIEELAATVTDLGASLVSDLDHAATAIVDRVLGRHTTDDDVCLLMCHAGLDAASSDVRHSGGIPEQRGLGPARSGRDN